jgi:hypothetical protein
VSCKFRTFCNILNTPLKALTITLCLSAVLLPPFLRFLDLLDRSSVSSSSLLRFFFCEDKLGIGGSTPSFFSAIANAFSSSAEKSSGEENETEL